MDVPRGLDVSQGRLWLEGRELVQVDSLRVLEPNGGMCDAAATEKVDCDSNDDRDCMMREVRNSSGK